MEGFVKGDIVVINFPFSDLSQTKKRPAMVIKVIGRNDLILCQITHRSYESSEEVPLHNFDFQKGNLKKDSFVRLTKIFTADISLIAYKAAILKPQKAQEIIDELCTVLKTE
jgi:mRNA interferase MazF